MATNPTPPDSVTPHPAGYSPATPRPQSRRDRRRILLWLFGAVLGIPLLAAFIFNWRASVRLQTALDDIAARGEPTTYAEAYTLLAANPPAADDNLAGVPLLLSMHDSEPGRAMRRQLEVNQPELLELWEQLVSRWGHTAGTKASSILRTSEDFDAWHPDSPQFDAEFHAWHPGIPYIWWSGPDEDWEWFEHNDGPAASVYLISEFLQPLVHQLAADCRHRSRALWSQAEFDEDDVFSVLVDQFGPNPRDLVKRAQTLRSIALAALARKDPELAAASLELSLALMRAGGEGEGLWALHLRAITAHLTDGPLFTGLSERAWSDEQLARLQRAIEHSLSALEPESMLRMGQVLDLTKIRFVKRQRDVEAERDRMPGAGPLVLKVLPDGAFDQMALRVIASYDHDWLQPGALLPQEVDRLESKLPEWLVWLEMMNPAEFLRIRLPPDHAHWLMIHARASETRLRLAHAAIALERFFLQHSRYPDHWQELIPGILDQPPLDPFTRGELVLLPADPAAGRQRPVIYSFGLNREDNGGTQGFDPDRPAVFGDQFATGDVVWGYPGDEPPAGPGDD